jgi:hypothetical protein
MPVASPAAASSNYPQDDQKQHGSDGGRDDRAHNPRANADAKLRQQPAADEGTDNPDDKVANEPEAGPLNKLAGKPARDHADDQYDEQTFIGNVHDDSPPCKACAALAGAERRCDSCAHVKLPDAALLAVLAARYRKLGWNRNVACEFNWQATERYQMAENSSSGGIGLLGVIIGAVIVIGLGVFFLGNFQGTAPTTKVSIEAPKIPAGK